MAAWVAASVCSVRPFSSTMGADITAPPGTLIMPIRAGSSMDSALGLGTRDTRDLTISSKSPFSFIALLNPLISATAATS